ncbi:MAG: hypothetical protein ACYTG5_10925 [Planctomycetota bacterium]
MSKELDESQKADEPQVDGESTPVETTQNPEELDGLMQEESISDQTERLDQEALAAAEEAVAAGELSLDHLAEQIEAAEQEVIPESEPSWILRGLLLLNLVLMVVMMALPEASEPQQPKPPATSSQPPANQTALPEEQDPFVSPPTESKGVVGDAGMRAIELAGEGNFKAAVRILEDWMQGEGAKEPDFLKRQNYRALSRYSWRLGNHDAAAKYDSLAESLHSYLKLPTQLLREAEEAEARGDGRLMRQAYARLLLVQSQVSPSDFNRITEAYLKLADSFRLETREKGEEEGK